MRAFRVFRTAVAALWCGFPSLGYLWMEKHVALEAVRGNAFAIGAPQALPVLGIAGSGLLGLAAVGVAYLLWTDPRTGLAAAILHDALLIALLGGSVLLLRPRGPVSPDAGSLGVTALAVGCFAAEAVFVAEWLRRPLAGAALALAYCLCAASLVL